MSLPSRAALAGLLLALAPACKTPKPRIPFDTGRGWMAQVSAGARSTGDRYIHSYTPVGLEIVTLTPGTAGWGWEVSFRYGEDTGQDKETKRPRVFGRTFFVPVEVERDSEIYELNLGVRQVFGYESPIHPYLGVGLTFMRIHNSDDLMGSYTLVNPNDPNQSVVYTPADEHSLDNSFGGYVRSGLNWRVTGEHDGDRLCTFLSTDVRGLIGHEWNYVELNFGIGIGR